MLARQSLGLIGSGCLALLLTLAVVLLASQVSRRPPPSPTTLAPAAATPPAAAAVAHLPALPVVPRPSESLAPAWRRFAVAARPGARMVAVIIDDMGLDHRRSALALALPAPLTMSFLTYADHLAEQAELARDHGHELMLHVPMQPLSAAFDAGPDMLSERSSPAEQQARLVRGLDRLQGYVGVNNHMGSRYTANAPGMRLVMAELDRRGLLFIDSLTSGASVGLATARQNGVPAAARDIFLDDLDQPDAIAAQLARVEALARRQGSVIAIGHPRDNTVAALAAWLPGLAAKGLTLEPVSAVVAVRLGGLPDQ
jgi:polysaccharide deacetylase 2 family uncharacterized protein YibQ